MSKKVLAFCAAAMVVGMGIASAAEAPVAAKNDAANTTVTTANNAATTQMSIKDPAAKKAKDDWGIEVRYFRSDFSGDYKSAKLHRNLSDTPVSIRDDLGFDKSSHPEVIFSYKNVSLDWISLNADATTEQPIMGGKIPKGSEADISVNYFKLKVENDLLKPGKMPGKSTLKWHYALAAMRVGVYARAANMSTSDAQLDFMPLVGLKFETPIAKNLNFNFGLSGIYASSDHNLYDLETGFSYMPVQNLYINLGYRDIKCEKISGGDEVSLRLKGPFLGLQYKF